MTSIFTAAHRGGAGPPLVCLHGFLDTWRTWELVLARLERHHEVLAPTLAGHAGGPPLPEPLSIDALPDAVERALDDAGWETVHLVGNSLGGLIALLLAARGRAASVVALAPSGGWARDDDDYRQTLAAQLELHERAKALAPRADALVATLAGRRRATALIATAFEHLPADLVAHQLIGVAACTGARPMVEHVLEHGYPGLDAAAITCPVRVVWGTEDRILPWPSAAVRHRTEWLPRADWVELDGAGHCPQLDHPLETAELILGLTTTSR